VNTNGNTDRIFPLVDYGEFYVKNFPLIYLSVNIDGNISLVYTERIIVGKE
jgi:hypothetical protein